MEFALRSYDKINVDICKDVTHLWSTLQAVQLLSLLPLFWWEWVMDEHSDIRAYTCKNAYGIHLVCYCFCICPVCAVPLVCHLWWSFTPLADCCVGPWLSSLCSALCVFRFPTFSVKNVFLVCSMGLLYPCCT